MKEYTIYPLTVGANETDQGIMTYQRYYGKRIWIPIYVFYIAGGEKNILVDTGLEEFMVPPEIGEKYGEIMNDDALMVDQGEYQGLKEGRASSLSIFSGSPVL
ncbi:MAG: hypothetical protein PHT49_10625 [Desulfovibrionales bacterium]|nr:hypothetical protein [Desulfovibrionales bacterium]